MGNEVFQCLTDIEKMYKIERMLGYAHPKRSNEKWMRIDRDVPKIFDAASSPVAVQMVCAWEMRCRVRFQCLTDV
jgi:hypothetical protein